MRMGMVFPAPVIPSVDTHPKVVYIQQAICIKRRGGHKKIDPCSQQHPDDAGGIYQDIVFSGIPHTYYLCDSAYPFLPRGIAYLFNKLPDYLVDGHTPGFNNCSMASAALDDAPGPPSFSLTS